MEGGAGDVVLPPCLPASPRPPAARSSQEGPGSQGPPHNRGHTLLPESVRWSMKGPGCSHGAACPTLQLPGSGAWHPKEGVGTPARLSWSLQGLPLLELQGAGG